MRISLLAAALALAFNGTVWAEETKDTDKSDKKAAKSAADPVDLSKACDDCPGSAGTTAWAEVGLGGQNGTASQTDRYTGFGDKDAWANAAGEYLYRGNGNGGFLDLKAANLGLDSREVSVEAGRQGKYGVTLHYDQIPNFRRNDALSPFQNAGSGQMTLPVGWVKEFNTTDLLSQNADLLTKTTLGTERDRLGFKFSLIQSKEWGLGGYYQHEEKSGTRDQSANILTTAVQLPVPVRYQTDNFGLAVNYQGKDFQARLGYDGSVFENDLNAIQWDNPFDSPYSSGQIAEAPDNQFHQISATLGYQLTDRTRLSARLNRGKLTQNESFLPYTVNPTISTSPLPATSLDGKVDTTLAKIEINSRPSNRMRVDASYTYSERDNKTPVNSYEYVVTDALLWSSLSLQNRPYSYEQHLLTAKVGYKISGNTDISGGFDRDQMNRTYVQVEETDDQTLWAKLKTSWSDTVETSLKLSYANRNASTPVPRTTFTGEPDLLLIHNLADRERNKLGIDVAFNPNEKLSLGVNVDYFKDDYDEMVLGLKTASGANANINLTYTFNESLSASTYYSVERLASKQGGLPTWVLSDAYLTQTVGVGANWAAIPKKLNVGADLVYSDYTGKIDFDNGTPLPNLGATLILASIHGDYKIKDGVTLRAAYSYERYKESDWANIIPSTVLTLGMTPQTQEVHLIYFSVRYAFK